MKTAYCEIEVFARMSGTPFCAFHEEDKALKLL